MYPTWWQEVEGGWLPTLRHDIFGVIYDLAVSVSANSIHPTLHYYHAPNDTPQVLRVR